MFIRNELVRLYRSSLQLLTTDPDLVSKFNLSLRTRTEDLIELRVNVGSLNCEVFFVKTVYLFYSTQEK